MWAVAFCKCLIIDELWGIKMFCKKCGKELPDNAVFCSNCGYSVNAVNHETAGASPVSNNSDDSDSSNNGRHKKQ